MEIKKLPLKTSVFKKFFGEVISTEEAAHIINTATLAFILVAGLQIILAILTQSVAKSVDGLIFLSLAIALRYFRSVLAATGVLVFALIIFVFTISSVITQEGGATNFLISLILLYLSIRVYFAAKFISKAKERNESFFKNKSF